MKNSKNINKRFLAAIVCLLVSSNQVTGAYAMNVDDQGQNSENVGTNQQDQSGQSREETQQDQSGQSREETQQNQSGQSREKTQQNQSSPVIVESGKSQNVQHHGLCLPSRAKANMLPPRTTSMALSNFKRSSGVGKVEISQNTNKNPQTNGGSKQCECCGKIKFTNKGGILPGLLTKNPHKIPEDIFLRTNLEMEGSSQNKPIFSCDGKIEVCGGSVTLKNLDIHGYFRVTNNASLTLENCVLTHNSNATPDAIAIECANGKVDMRNCVVKDCLVISNSAGLMAYGSEGFSSYVSKSTINCDHCSFDQKMPQQNLNPENYNAERRRHQCSLLALNGGIICCSGCDFNSNVPQNNDVYANEKGLIKLDGCNLSLNGSISRCFSQNGVIKIKNSSFGCGSFNKNSNVEICSCNGVNVSSQCSKIKILNTQMQNTHPGHPCFNFKNSDVECKNVISQNLINIPIFFVTSSKVRGENMTFAPSRFVVYAKDGSDISLINHNISLFSNSIAINSKISHTGILNCELVGTGMETILGSDEVITKLDFKSDIDSKISQLNRELVKTGVETIPDSDEGITMLERKNQNIDLDNLIYSSNGTDIAKNDFVLKLIENCSGKKLFDFVDENSKPCTKQPTMSKLQRMQFFKYLMSLPNRTFMIDKFGRCFARPVYDDDMNPLLLKHRSVFSGIDKANKEDRFSFFVDAVGSRCPICLDEEGLDMVLLPCKHVCHAECLSGAPGVVVNCPVCGKKIISKFFA